MIEIFSNSVTGKKNVMKIPNFIKNERLNIDKMDANINAKMHNGVRSLYSIIPNNLLE